MSKTKVDRLRGKRQHGKGNTKNKKSGGCKGGRGKGGSFKQKITKYAPLVGTKITLKPKKKEKAITLTEINRQADKDNVFDLKKHGFKRVLATGNLTKKITIKNANHITEKAKEKIESFGGKIE